MSASGTCLCPVKGSGRFQRLAECWHTLRIGGLGTNADGKAIVCEWRPVLDGWDRFEERPRKRPALDQHPAIRVWRPC